MTIIHECDRCNAPGRVIETSDGFRCEGCYEEAQEQVRSDASCPECGRLGVTATGICYACENTAPVRRGITRACRVPRRRPDPPGSPSPGCIGEWSEMRRLMRVESSTEPMRAGVIA